MQSTIVFGGGCFWCTEAVFKSLKGVVRVRSGYAGGYKENPSYEEVCAGKTGHAETAEVVYEDAVVKLDELLSAFFATHDPSTSNRQGNDVGEQYRSAIYFTSVEQKTIIDEFIKKLKEENVFPKITTEIKTLEKFYPAEAYHQNYFQNNPESAYCQAVINPKLGKLRKKYAALLK